MFEEILRFIILGLWESVPIVIEAIPKVDIKSDWLADEIKDTFRPIHAAGFNMSILI